MTNTGEQIYNFYNMNNFLDKAKHNLGELNFRYLLDIVNQKMSMFSYKNLPPTYTNEIVENALLFMNCLCWYDIPVFGITLCRYIPNNTFDKNFKPISVNLMSLSGKTLLENVNYQDIILCKDNRMDIPPFLALFEYMQKLDNIEKTLFTNLEVLKLPSVFTGEKSMVASFNSMIQKALGFKPFAMADKSMIDSFKQFDIKLPIQPSDLMELFKQYKNMTLNSCGIFSNDTQKKERLLVNEVQSQTDYVDNIYNSFKKCRLDFVEQLNKQYNLKIELVEEYKEYTMDSLKLQEQFQDKNNIIKSEDNNNGR